MTPDPLSAVTADADQTRAMAGALAGTTVAGDLLLLVGEMGTGKTVFAQGLGAGLGVTEQITSPTFTIVHEYPGRLAFHHLDAYRLEFFQEVAELGIAEMLDEPAVMLVEWGDVILPALLAEYLEVRILYGDDDDHRLFSFTPVGSRWMARHRVMDEVLAPWRTQPPSATGDEGPGSC